MLRKIKAIGFVLLTTSYAYSQESAPSATTATSNQSQTDAKVEKKPVLNFSGSVDFYYRYDFNKQQTNNKTSFTNSHNSFSLGMASVKLEHSFNKVSAVVDLGFGTRASEFSYNETGILQSVKQAYISYAVTDALKITAGTWATHVGYELVDPQLNRNYSMGYMFTNGPFTHTGVKAEYTKGKSSFMLGLSNATDFRVPPSSQINKKFVIAQYTLAASDKVKFYANYVGGKQIDTSNVSQYDIVGTFTLSSKFNFALNGTLNRSQSWDGIKNVEGKSWYGLAGYFNYDPSSTFGLTLRSEYFDDSKGVKGLGTSIFANTISANIKADGFTLIPELRFESAGANIYSDAAGNFNKKGAVSFLLAAVYKF